MAFIGSPEALDDSKRLLSGSFNVESIRIHSGLRGSQYLFKRQVVADEASTRHALGKGYRGEGSDREMHGISILMHAMSYK